MDNKLFNKEDILTSLTVDKAKIGDNGYFGDNLKEIEFRVERDEVYPLVWIDRKNLSVYSFKNNFFEDHFALFLPADKVKKEPKYRPLRTLDELFNFLLPDFTADTYDTYDKAELTLHRMYELKSKRTGNMCYKRFSQIYLSDNYIRLDEYNLEHLFKEYEIKKDGEFVPFGVEEVVKTK